MTDKDHNLVPEDQNTARLWHKKPAREHLLQAGLTFAAVTQSPAEREQIQ